MARDASGESRVVGRPEVSSTRSDGETIFIPESQFGSRRLLSYVGLTLRAPPIGHLPSPLRLRGRAGAPM